MWSHDVEMKELRGGRTWMWILWRWTWPCSWMAWMEGSHCCLRTCSNVAANGRLESLCILWCMCILTCFVDASDMANVCELIYASTVSASDTIHTHLKNIWPCSSNTASISACLYMALILSMGRAQGWYDHHGHLLMVPCHWSIPYQMLCISPPEWEAKSWCRWSWKWWRVYKTKDTVFFIVIQGPCTWGGALSSRSSQVFVVFSMMSSSWQVSQTRTPLLDWTWFGSGLNQFFFFSFGCTTHILGKIRPNKESKAESEGSIQHKWYLHALMHITCLEIPHVVVC